jgi:hypothetical protein
MINRLSMPDGEPLPQTQDQFMQAIGELLTAHAQDVVTLEPGVYNVTPKVWTKNTHDHELTVLDNGTGLYRIYPKYSDAGYHLFDPDNTPSGTLPEVTPGGRVQPLDDQNRIAIVAGGHPRKTDRLQMFEILFYTPQMIELVPRPEERQEQPEQSVARKLSQLLSRFLRRS